MADQEVRQRGEGADGLVQESSTVHHAEGKREGSAAERGTGKAEQRERGTSEGEKREGQT